MNTSIKQTRIYHPYWLWEDYQSGFYENVSGAEKKQMTDKVLEMFNDAEKTKECMFFVVDNWKYSCEHNLTNESLNQIAYIGQAACCVYAKVPNTITMEAWSKLSKEVQKRSDEIAKEAIQRWNEKNKLIQTCLNLD